MQRKIFFPAISLLNRLNYTRKFSLLWILSMFSIAVVVYGLFVMLDRVIQPAQKQLQGITLIEPISRTVQAIQLHRGFAAAVLSGRETLWEQRAAQEDEAVRIFTAMEEKLPASLTSAENFQRIKADWESLRKEQKNSEKYKNFAAHTRLIKQLHEFEIFVADEYLLTLDPELASYYLLETAIHKLPHALEHLGQIRAYVTIILSERHLSEEQKIQLHILMAELETTLAEFRDSLDKSGRYNPKVQTALRLVADDIDQAAQKITSFIKADIFSGRLHANPGAFLEMATAVIDRGYVLMHESLLPTAEMLIEARIDQAKITLYTNSGISMLVFLLVVYLSVSIYYAIIGSIQALVHALHRFAEGDLKVQVQLDTDDELSRVGSSFNEMVQQFGALMDTHREDEDRLRATLETAMDAVVKMDVRGIITGWNRQAEKIFGWTAAEALGRVLGETIIPPQYRDAHTEGLQRFLRSGEGPILNIRTEMTGLHRNGHEFPVELSIAPIKLGDPEAGNYEFSAFIRDITEQKASEELIWNQANFDSLTGLPNRRMFHDRLTQDIRKAHRAGLKIALLFIDLDKFKEVNDTLGHSLGDILLQEAARRISGCVREADTVARLGGDEFTVILTGLEDIGSIDRVAENILQNLAKPFQLENEIAYVSASIGITLYPDDAVGIEDMLKNADQAMYVAKNKGRNRFDYFTSSMQQAAQMRLQLTNELRSGLEASQFLLYYQPIVDVSSGRIIKAEALVRWQHPKRGLVSPALFIPLAEETGLIIEIGEWVFREAARQVKRWQALYNDKFQVSVNVSPVQFGCTAGCIGSEWLSYLQELDVPGQGMVIEITESLLLDADPEIARKLAEFRDAGLQTAIDDFGTGYSSLSYLKKFDIDYLKIDQSFVRDLATDHNDRALSEAIIVMAHKLGLKVIAEGVETEEQCNLLSVAGCDYGQGYLFSRPMPAEELEALLKNNQPLGVGCIHK
ncbi:MAG: EAL domain-containing protein [Sideroxydans sp.]|jgi:diguanylate cyclase (GGDEF)-like protein/PAS domain S-box-containing protein